MVAVHGLVVILFERRVSQDQLPGLRPRWIISWKVLEMRESCSSLFIYDSGRMQPGQFAYQALVATTPPYTVGGTGASTN